MRQGLDLTVQRYGRQARQRRRVRTALLAAALALLAGLAVLRFGPGAAAWLAAAPRQAELAVGSLLLPHYSEQLAGLAAQNAALRANLADAARLQEENRALRSLLESPAAGAARGAQPFRVAARTAGRFALAGSAPAGRAVLDWQGRFAGRTAEPEAGASPGLLPVSGAEGTPCLAGDQHGVLKRQGGRWYLDGLPRHCGLAAGCVVTTADGWWVGTLADGPVEDETGLCASAPLADTADLGASVYFVASAAP